MFSYKANAICMVWYDHANWSWCSSIALLEQSSETPDSSLIMSNFDLTGELSLKIELHMLRPLPKKYTVAMGQFR